MFSWTVLTAWPVDAPPCPVDAIALMLALRAVSAATDAEPCSGGGGCGLGPRETETVPATAFVDWVPVTSPPVELT